MNALINTMLPTTSSPSAGVDNGRMKSVKSDPSSSFARHLEKDMAAERRENLVGVEKRREARAQKGAEASTTREKAENAGNEITNPESSIYLLLAKLIDRLQIAAEDKSMGPGQWTIPAAGDTGFLEQLALHAGMDPDQITGFLQKLEAGNGEIDLTEFLQALNEHFNTIAESNPVTVPETDLPLLENLLVRMGVSVEEVRLFSEQAVIGDGTFDLGEFLTGLEKITSETGAIEITGWEKEQLQQLLAQAGVSPEMRDRLFAGQSGRKMELDLALLKNMIDKGLADIEMNKARPNLAAFLQDLNEVLEQAGFMEKNAGWTPVVQEAVEDIYKDLMQVVDMSEIKIRKGQPGMSAGREMLAANLTAEQQEEMLLEEELLNQEFLKAENSANEKPRNIMGLAKVLQQYPDLLGSKTENLHPDVMTNVVSATAVTEQQIQNPVAEVKPQQVPGFSQQMQQQAFSQISQGVLRGLSNNEHHLIIKLYPPELGEVKIDLMIRDQQVAVNFGMENSRVKEMLESNMDQFRENMHQKGFELADCQVSVGQHDDPETAWSRFEQQWSWDGRKSSVTSLDDLPEEILYRRSVVEQAREGGVNLFV